LGNIEGVRFPGLLIVAKEGCGYRESFIKLILALFLPLPDKVRSLSLGAIWNFIEGPGLPRLGISVWGTKGLF
jgi:hypothetical protein